MHGQVSASSGMIYMGLEMPKVYLRASIKACVLYVHLWFRLAALVMHGGYTKVLVLNLNCIITDMGYRNKPND